MRKRKGPVNINSQAPFLDHDSLISARRLIVSLKFLNAAMIAGSKLVSFVIKEPPDL